MRQKNIEMNRLRVGLFFLISTCFCLLVAEEDRSYLSMQMPSSPAQSIDATVHRQQTSIMVGQVFWLSVDLIFPEGLRSGWTLPLGDWPATQIQLSLPKPLEVRDIKWPIPKVDLSVFPPQVYYQGRITALIEVFWKGIEEKTKQMPLLQGQLLVTGQARWLNQANYYELIRLATLPKLLLPNEIPLPEDPFTLSRYKQIKENLPQRVDPADVDWQIGKGGIEIRGKNLSLDSRWLAIAYRQQSQKQTEVATLPIVLRHLKKEDKDVFDVLMKTIEEWKQAQVEEILLINEKSDQAWIISLLGDETINYSLMQQFSS